MEGTGDDNVEMEDGVQRMWILSSDHWELLNVFSLPEFKCCNLEWMTVFSSLYPSATTIGGGNKRPSPESWLDNYKVSLNRKKQSEKKDTDPKDKDQE
jgi:hypothetical protein